MATRPGGKITIKPLVTDKENLKEGRKAADVTKKTTVNVNPTRRPAFKEVKTNSNEKTAELASNKDTEKLKVVVKPPEKIINSPVQRPTDVTDIDTSSNPLLVSEYAKDIYAYLLTLEEKYSIKEGFLVGHPSTPKMRSILIDWLVEVHLQFKLVLETLHMTVSIVDRYLQENKTIGKPTLQLVGVTAMFVACKYEEMYSPAVSDFIYICDKAFTKEQILKMEADILKTLDFNFSRPLSLHFLRRYSKATKADGEQHVLAKYLLELVLIDHELCHVKSSIQAAAAICLSVSVLNGLPDPAQAWTKNLMYYSGYKFADIKVTIVKLACAVGRAENSPYQSITTKYAVTRYNKISQNKKLKCNLIRKLISNSPLTTRN